MKIAFKPPATISLINCSPNAKNQLPIISSNSMYLLANVGVDSLCYIAREQELSL